MQDCGMRNWRKLKSRQKIRVRGPELQKKLLSDLFFTQNIEKFEQFGVLLVRLSETVTFYKLYFVNIEKYNNQLMVVPTARFNKARSLRHSISLSIKVQQLCVFLQSIIMKEKGSSFVCCSSNKSVSSIDQNFSRSFQKMSQQDQIEYYIYLVEFAHEQKLNPKYETEQSFVTFQGYYRNDGTFSKTWQKSRLELCSNEYKLTIIGNRVKTVSLRNYLLRKSADKNKFTFALMSIHSQDVLRIGFTEWTTLNKCYNIVSQLIRISHANNLFHQNLKSNGNIKVKSQQKRVDERVRPNTLKIRTNSKEQKQLFSFKVLAQQILQKDSNIPVDEIDRQNDVIIQQSSGNGKRNTTNPLSQIVKQKQHLDIFPYFMPYYNLEKIESQYGYHLIRFSDSHKIFQHNVIANKFKLVLYINSNKTQILPIISNVLSYPSFNPKVSISDIKQQILSQNSAICYQSHYPYSQYCHPRDFLYLRYLFVVKNKTYMIDKSIDPRMYPPFTTVVRGHISYGLWMIEELENSSKLILEIEMDHGGSLSKNQNQTLTVRYLEGIIKMKEFIKQDKYVFNDPVFNLNWDIDKNQKNFEGNLRRRSFKKSFKDDSEFSQSMQISTFQVNICEQIEEFHTIENQYQNESIVKVQDIDIEAKQIQKPAVPIIELIRNVTFDKNGKIIIPSNNIHQKWKLLPYETQYVAVNKKQIWGDNWRVQNNGLVKFKQNQRLETLDKAFNHLMGSVENDLIKGEKIHSLQLPVDAFGKESFLQRLARSFTLVQKLMRDKIEQQSAVTKISCFLAVGLSSCLSIATEVIEKAFEPLLGQTYQGWINGCPIYCEQLSTNPPISSFLMYGKGFKIYGNVQCKVALVSLNKCIYQFEGCYTLKLNNNQKIYFYPPKIQISGLSFGDKTLNLLNKCSAFYPEEQLYAEILLKPQNKHEDTTNQIGDTIKGGIYKIRGADKNTFKQIITSQSNELRTIIEKSQNISPIRGKWTSHINIGNISYYQIDKDIPHVLRQEDFPLSSNSNYRQDIIYRREEKIIKAQIAKQKLEQNDKLDQKLRSKTTN